MKNLDKAEIDICTFLSTNDDTHDDGIEETSQDILDDFLEAQFKHKLQLTKKKTKKNIVGKKRQEFKKSRFEPRKSKKIIIDGIEIVKKRKKKKKKKKKLKRLEEKYKV